jgi:hypothetical protein
MLPACVGLLLGACSELHAAGICAQSRLTNFREDPFPAPDDQIREHKKRPGAQPGEPISATGPVDVVAVFRQLGVPERLATTVEGESMLNDGVAIVGFSVVLGAAIGAAEVSRFRQPLRANLVDLPLRGRLGDLRPGAAGYTHVQSWILVVGEDEEDVRHLRGRGRRFALGVLTSPPQEEHTSTAASCLL